MAHQLHYTSAATGMSGRAGFQFVAASPGADAAVQQAVTPYLVYRPPPSAPSQPSPAQLAGFPVAYGYVRAGRTAILTRCRYLGIDYSGRYGNFLGHAVVADEKELAGLNPVTLWDSPIWATTPASSPHLPEIRKLPSGPGLDREATAAWLAAPDGGGGRYDLLAELTDAALAALDGAAGQVILVSRSPETVMRWTAAVAQSLPLAWAHRLSFVSYAGDVARARPHLVGTTPDALPARTGGGATVFPLDPPAPVKQSTARPYAAGQAESWRRGDLPEVDLVNRLLISVAATPGERDAAADLAALCRGEPPEPLRAAAVAAFVTDRADRLPDWAWEDLAQRAAAASGLEIPLAVHRAAVRTGRRDVADRVGAVAVRLGIGRQADRRRLAGVRLSGRAAADLAGPVADALRTCTDLTDLGQVVQVVRSVSVPVTTDGLRTAVARAALSGLDGLEALIATVDDDQRPAVRAGVVDGLATVDEEAATRLLTDQACDVLEWRECAHVPAVAVRVLASRGRRHPAQREEVTEVLADLAGDGHLPEWRLAGLLRGIWHSGPPPPPELCRRLLDQFADDQRTRQVAIALSQQSLLTTDVSSQEALALADRLRHHAGRGRRDPATASADAVVAAHRARGGDPQAFVTLHEVGDFVPARLHQQVAAVASEGFVASTPMVQADVLHRLPGRSRFRRQLVKALLERTGKRVDSRAVDLAEVAVRLSVRGTPDADLARRVQQIGSRTAGAKRLRDGLRGRKPSLLSGLERLLEAEPPRRWAWLPGRRGPG